MNREAVALGTPVYTTFAERLGAVDEGLVSAGRLRRLAAVDELAVERAPARRERTFRDPTLMLDLMLSAVDG